MCRSDFLFYSKTRFTLMGRPAFFFPILSRLSLFPRLLPKARVSLNSGGETQ